MHIHYCIPLYIVCSVCCAWSLSLVQLFVTPGTVACQASLFMGVLQTSILAGGGSSLSCPPPGDLPNPGIEPMSPALQADSLPSEPPGKPKNTGYPIPSPGDLPNPEVSCIAGGFFTS